MSIKKQEYIKNADSEEQGRLHHVSCRPQSKGRDSAGCYQCPPALGPETAGGLLQTEEIGCNEVSSPEGSHYLFLFDGKGRRPYPSVMIWKIVNTGGGDLLVDMDERDMPAVAFAERNYLLPEGMEPRGKGCTLLRMERK
ncbi:MAG: hypothetical protein ACOX68_03505 [Candidatus Limivicinus sp.]|jgi:hypothetical protein